MADTATAPRPVDAPTQPPASGQPPAAARRVDWSHLNAEQHRRSEQEQAQIDIAAGR